MLDPKRPLRFRGWAPTLQVTIGAAIVLSVIVAAVINGIVSADVLMFILILIGPFAVIVALMIAYTLKNREVQNRFARSAESYKATLKLVNKRCRELTDRQRQIESVLSRIGETASEQLTGVRNKLLNARQIAQKQFARYFVMGTEIELIQLQNTLSPLVYDLDRIDFSHIDKGFSEVDKALERLNFIREHLPKGLGIESGLSDETGIVDKTTDTIDACGKLREALIGRQAIEAIQGIGPASLEVESGQIAGSASHVLETFNIQIDFTDFAASLEELELEYQRLMSEDKLSRKLLKKVDSHTEI
ncbi:MAG: hypothetical protein ABIP75_15975 [Pyrinomonadaceae bacterium]